MSLETCQIMHERPAWNIFWALQNLHPLCLAVIFLIKCLWVNILFDNSTYNLRDNCDAGMKFWPGDGQAKKALKSQKFRQKIGMLIYDVVFYFQVFTSFRENTARFQSILCFAMFKSIRLFKVLICWSLKYFLLKFLKGTWNTFCMCWKERWVIVSL